MGPEPLDGELADSSLLAHADRCRGRAEEIGPTRLDLAEDVEVVAAQHEIELAGRCTPVAVDDDVAATAVVGRGHPFAPRSAGRVRWMGRHGTPPVVRYRRGSMARAR